jgi:hypothetical protein
MTQILQIISNHLTKHRIPHTTYKHCIGIQNPPSTTTTHIQHTPDNTITLTKNYHPHHTDTIIDLADPKLLTKITQHLT